MKLTDKINIHHIDCMEFMKSVPDNYYELGIIDPPYGINITAECMGGRNTVKPDKLKQWDKITPTKEYFNEIFRISKNQIIWGGNYFDLPSSRYFAIWDKGETMYGRDFAEAEYAWIKKGGTRIFKCSPNQLQRIHCTQKPVTLYELTLKNYAKPNDKIIDTHAGSLSIGIAVDKANVYDKMNLTLDACEIDADYYNDSIKRFKKYKQQMVMEL